jgi:hypothetical protein
MKNKMRSTFGGLIAITAAAGVMLAPITASAQSRQDQSNHRQDTKNQWRNIGIGSAAVGVLGLLKHDNTLTFAGAAGALYSANRYEQDRKSQSKIDHARADMFSRNSFDRNGHHYVRKTVNKNGHKYYQFVRNDHR